MHCVEASHALKISSSTGRKVTKIITLVMPLTLLVIDDMWLVLTPAQAKLVYLFVVMGCQMAGSGQKSMHKGKGY